MFELSSAAQAELRALAREWLRCATPDSQNMVDRFALKLGAVVGSALRVTGCVRVQLVEEAHELPVLEKLLLLVSQTLGFLVPQSHKLDTLSFVQNEGHSYAEHTTRGHQTNAALAFHSDRCDLNILLYVRPAMTGGALSVVSYEHAADLLRERDVAAYNMLFDGFPFDLRDERIFPSIAWNWRPILWRYGTTLRGHYIRRFIQESQRHPDCPRLSSSQFRALDYFDAALQSLRDDHTFMPQPGELVFLNNYRVMHARSKFEDDSNPSSTRLVMRTWVAPFDSEPLPCWMHAMVGSCAAGSYRGGVGRGVEYLQRLGRTDVSAHSGVR